MNEPSHRIPKKACPTRRNTAWMVWLRVVKILSPLEFICEESLDHQYPMRVHVAQRVSVSDSVGKKVDKDANPVGVVAIDREAQMIIRKGIDAATAGSKTEPR